MWSCRSGLKIVYGVCRSDVRVRDSAEDGEGAESDGVRLGLSRAQPRYAMESADRGHRPLAFDKVSLSTHFSMYTLCTIHMRVERFCYSVPMALKGAWPAQDHARVPKDALESYPTHTLYSVPKVLMHFLTSVS